MQRKTKILYKICYLIVTILAFNILSAHAQIYNFTTCGAVGKNGPVQAQVNSTYTGSNTLTGSVTIGTQGIQQWTVPTSGIYKISIAGAKGGLSAFSAAGSGRSISTEVNLTAGQVINVVVGQQGQQSSSNTQYSAGGSGGGGSYVYTGAIGSGGLIVAAAGGGGGLSSPQNVQPGNVSNGNFGTSGSTIFGYNNYQVALGGTGGNGGGFSDRTILSGSPGSGWISDYNPTYGSPNTYLGGTRFVGGSPNNNGKDGGFGGGGASGDNSNHGYTWTWASGGGGYSGGAAGHNVGAADGQVGGGGGSFITGSNQTDLGLNNGNGFVTITALTFPATGLNFDGVNDYVNIGDNSNLKLPSSFTIEAWLRPTGSSTGYGTIVNKEGEYEILRFPDGTMQFALGSNWVFNNTNLQIPLNTWTHIYLSYNANTRVLTAGNGTSTFSQTNVAPIADGDEQPLLNELRIGGRQIYTSSNYFNGDIDEVRIWNRGLSEAEILNNLNCELSIPQTGLVAYYQFNEGLQNAVNTGITNLPDISGNNRNGTLNNFGLSGNASNWVAGKTSGTCTSFDNEPPVIVCPADITVSTDEGVCTAVVNFEATATDASGVASITYDIQPGSVFLKGTTKVTVTATDNLGQSSNCDFTVTVNDEEKPTVVTQNITVQLNALGTATITAAQINNVSTDNCSIPEDGYSLDVSSFD